MYKVTTPSKRPGLHKRTFYDSALQKNSLRSSKHTHRERQAVDGKFSAKTRSETEDGREPEGAREGNIKGEERKTLKSHSISLIKERC